jgi:hypothetical protein
MAARDLDAETLREVFVYLYRCWLHRYLGELPERLGLSATDGALISQNLSLYYSTQPVTEGMLADLDSRLRQPLYLFAPAFPKGAAGVTAFDRRTDAPTPFPQILDLVDRHWAWLQAHRERALTRSEAYERLDHGTFAVWRSKAVTRLLLHPSAADAYGYVVVRNAPRDYFLRRSKSCKEEGTRIAEGDYKRTKHRQETKSYGNFDLLMNGGKVLLLHMTTAGAGYKAFPRQTPEPEFKDL